MLRGPVGLAQKESPGRAGTFMLSFLCWCGSVCQFAEREVDAETDICVGSAYRYELRADLEELRVAADEEVESSGVEVEQPSE